MLALDKHLQEIIIKKKEKKEQPSKRVFVQFSHKPAYPFQTILQLSLGNLSVLLFSFTVMVNELATSIEYIVWNEI